MLAAIILNVIVTTWASSSTDVEEIAGVTSAPEYSNAFGVPLEDLRELVERQPFVSSCQYAILKIRAMYNQAKNQCTTKLEGLGKIAAIRNQKENDAVHMLFVATYGHGIDNRSFKSNPSNYIWIGLSRNDEHGSKWQWDNNAIPVNYTNWKPGHPKEGTNTRMNRRGFWESTTNIMYHPSACERKAKYVVYKKRLSYNAAHAVCSNMSMTLAKVKDVSENVELARAASRSLGSPYMHREFEHVNQIWVGGYQGKDGNLYWEDGTTITYRNFEPEYGLEFSGTGNAKVSMDKLKRDWKLEKGTEERSFACQCSNPGIDEYRPKDIFPHSGPNTDIQPLVNQTGCKKRFYPDTRQMTYNGATTACRKQGYQLAKIESGAENAHSVRLMNSKYRGQFIKDLFDPFNWFWVGASDDVNEGDFLWDDNTQMVYTNWGRGQPDNAHPTRGGQSKVSIYRGTGHWDDAHPYRRRAFMCYDKSVSLKEELEDMCDEIVYFIPSNEPDAKLIRETSTEETPKEDIMRDPMTVSTNEYIGQKECVKEEYQGEYYVSSTTQTYDESKRLCEQRDMALASIFNTEANARLRNLALNRVPTTAYVLATMGELSWFWVGLKHDGESQLKWLSGTQTTYENFVDYYTRNKYIDNEEETKNVLAVSKVDGSWEWRSRGDKYMFICEEPHKWICILEKGKKT